MTRIREEEEEEVQNRKSSTVNNQHSSVVLCGATHVAWIRRPRFPIKSGYYRDRYRYRFVPRALAIFTCAPLYQSA